MTAKAPVSRPLPPILFLASNPAQTVNLRLSDELKRLRARLSPRGHNAALRYHPDARLEELTRLLQDDREIRIVHFSGHGTEDGRLQFGAREEAPQEAEPGRLTALFAAASDRLECVFLNACHSDEQAELIGRHVEWVVGMASAVTDQVAIDFAEHFYVELADEGSYGGAFRVALAHVGLKDEAQADVPRLYRNGALVEFDALAVRQRSPKRERHAASEEPLVDYRIAHGWAGMYHLLHGAERLFGERDGPTPRLLNTPVMALIRTLQPLVGWAEGEPLIQWLDTRALADMGAPFVVHPPRSEWMRSPAPGVSPGWWLRSTEAWTDVGPGCGWGLAELAVEEEGAPNGEVERRARALKAWMRKSLEFRSGDWTSEFLAPVIEILPVQVYCLYLRGALGTRIYLNDADSTPKLTFELDERPVLIPLGLAFEERSPGPEGEWCGPEPDSDDPDDPLFEMPASRHPNSLHERLEALYERMRGPRLEVTSLAWNHRGVDNEMQLRGPRHVWDCVSLYFMGASCPEVFIRVDEQPWRHLGPVLVGADSPHKARSEALALGRVPAGRQACLVLREIPNEKATLEARLWASTGDARWLVDATPVTELGAHDVITLRMSAQSVPIDLELEVQGFFVRLEPERASRPSS